MCTLTFYPKKNGDLIFTFNRDEQPKRSSVTVVADKNEGIIYPKDSLHNGTWLVADTRKKRVTCLLNGAFTLHERQLPYRKSRGLVVLDSARFEHIDAFFTFYDFDNIEPFTMVVWERDTLSVARWDGTLIHIEKPNPKYPHIWSSCTLYDTNMQKERAYWFTEWQAELSKSEANPADLWKFHHTGGQNDPENALCMTRQTGVKTVSASQIILTENNLKFLYYEFRNNVTYDQDFHLQPQPIGEFFG
jgi:hypothetical protein